MSDCEVRCCNGGKIFAHRGEEQVTLIISQPQEGCDDLELTCNLTEQDTAALIQVLEVPKPEIGGAIHISPPSPFRSSHRVPTFFNRIAQDVIVSGELRDRMLHLQAEHSPYSSSDVFPYATTAYDILNLLPLLRGSDYHAVEETIRNFIYLYICNAPYKQGSLADMILEYMPQSPLFYVRQYIEGGTRSRLQMAHTTLASTYKEELEKHQRLLANTPYACEKEYLQRICIFRAMANLTVVQCIDAERDCWNTTLLEQMVGSLTDLLNVAEDLEPESHHTERVSCLLTFAKNYF